MNNELFKKKELAIEVIATGSTIDDDNCYGGTHYRITTWTFRMNHVGVDRWYHSEPVYWNCNDYPYKTKKEYTEQWAAYRKKKEAREKARAELEEDIANLLPIPQGTRIPHVTNNLSEIYTAVQIIRVDEGRPSDATN